MLEIVIDACIVVPIDRLDATAQESNQRVVLFLCHVVGYRLSPTVQHADSIAQLDPQLN